MALQVPVLSIRPRIECASVIPMIIQSVQVLPSGPDQVDAPPNLSRENPIGSD